MTSASSSPCVATSPSRSTTGSRAKLTLRSQALMRCMMPRRPCGGSARMRHYASTPCVLAPLALQPAEWSSHSCSHFPARETLATVACTCGKPIQQPLRKCCPRAMRRMRACSQPSPMLRRRRHRGLKALMGAPRGAPDVTYFPIPTVKGVRDHPFLLPHFFFCFIISTRTIAGGRR